jgi:hypothetical protein
MRTMNRRVSKLEDRFRPAGGTPRGVRRYLVSMSGSQRSLGGATCQRSLWPDGTLFELVMFNDHGAGADEVTDDELERSTSTFPVHGLNAPDWTR